MDFLIPVLIVVVVVALVLAVLRLVARRRSGDPDASVQAQAQAGLTADVARSASARLTEEQHRSVYSLIAQEQVLSAVQTYRKATRSSLKESALAVAALQRFPQQFTTAPPAERSQPPAGTAPYRYRAIVSRGDQVREIASTRLDDQIFTDVRSLALAGDYDGAARLLLEHSDVTLDQAHDFVALIGPDHAE